MVFQSVTHGPVELPSVILIIKNFLEDDPDADYSLVIGTDSHEKNDTNGELKVKSNGHTNGYKTKSNGHNNGYSNGSKKINLVTAVLIHRKGFGGKYFWVRRETPNIHSLRE